MKRGIDAYRRTEAQSASPLQLVVMLYDGALRFLNEARAAHARSDMRARGAALRRVAAIVAECQSTLDLERGGAVAAELDRLYSYISARLLDITVKRDATAIDETYKLMSTLREAWAQAATSGVIATAAPPPAEVALRP
ncbi:MAG TPA: flagellar export chaperone FliS [Vicinamibacterales bacterium]|nr:flagellar export chaperone FliS [Vicinamibacterales bacterium]